MDYITDIMTRMKNANGSNKETVVFPYSTLGMSIVETLVRSGFISGATRKGKKTKLIEVGLLYENNMPRISGFKRLSKQSKRVYSAIKNIKSVRNGYGKVVISTPQGIMTGEDAKKANVGGELLFEIW